MFLSIVATEMPCDVSKNVSISSSKVHLDNPLRLTVSDIVASGADPKGGSYSVHVCTKFSDHAHVD